MHSGPQSACIYISEGKNAVSVGSLSTQLVQFMYKHLFSQDNANDKRFLATSIHTLSSYCGHERAANI